MSGQPVGLADLTDAQHVLLRLRVEHLLETETGFRSGDPRDRATGEPRTAFDPAATTLTGRRRAKVAELRAMGEQARLLGLGQVSERTLERWAAAWDRDGILGCLDRRLVRAGGGHPSVDDRVAEAMREVHAETLHRSRVSMRTRERLIHSPRRATHGAEETRRAEAGPSPEHADRTPALASAHEARVSTDAGRRLLAAQDA